jgi:hypothetical protein
MNYPDRQLSEDPLELINLYSLMDIILGDPRIFIGLNDVPVDLNQPAFQVSQIRAISESYYVKCRSANSIACSHCTFIVGILCANRDSPAPAICPGCKYYVQFS